MPRSALALSRQACVGKLRAVPPSTVPSAPATLPVPPSTAVEPARSAAAGGDAPVPLVPPLPEETVPPEPVAPVPPVPDCCVPPDEQARRIDAERQTKLGRNIGRMYTTPRDSLASW